MALPRRRTFSMRRKHVFLKPLITDGQHLIDQDQVQLEVGRDRDRPLDHV
jgi:hypothetical protein